MRIWANQRRTTKQNKMSSSTDINNKVDKHGASDQSGSSSSSTSTPTASTTPQISSGSTFNDENFIKKLDRVQPTTESIQSLALWIMHHKNNHEIICRLWFKRLSEGKFIFGLILDLVEMVPLQNIDSEWLSMFLGRERKNLFMIQKYVSFLIAKIKFILFLYKWVAKINWRVLILLNWIFYQEKIFLLKM